MLDMTIHENEVAGSSKMSFELEEVLKPITNKSKFFLIVTDNTN